MKPSNTELTGQRLSVKHVPSQGESGKTIQPLETYSIHPIPFYDYHARELHLQLRRIAVGRPVDTFLSGGGGIHLIVVDLTEEEASIARKLPGISRMYKESEKPWPYGNGPA